MRWTLTAVLLASLALIPASPASAGTLTTTNACLWSFDGLWRDQAIDLTGSGAPTPVAPSSGFALTSTSIHARLPDWVGQYGANLGMLKPGENEIRTKVWVALAADSTGEGIQVKALDAIVRTTVTEQPDGTYTSTPIDVTLPIPDTAWTSAAADGVAAFKQAGAGTLPTIPGGNAGASVKPKGSVFISAAFAGGASLQLDCQPGSAPRDGKSFAAVVAGAFESVPIKAGSVVLPAPKSKPAIVLRTTKLRVSGKRVAVALSCTGAACSGTVSLKYASGLAAQSAKYSLAAGASKTLKLTLSAKARKSLKKKSLLVQVKITTAGGKTVSKKLRLK